MSYLGWFALGGTEVINGPRFETYARNAGAPGFRSYFKFPELADLLGQQRYRSPFQDTSVPWTDPDDPDTYGFYGFYPTGVDGIDSSTRTSTITEYTNDGGSPGRIRHATKQMVFTGFLMGSSDRAVDAGMRWLRSVLLSGADGGCIGGGCDGAQLCYLYAEPEVPDNPTEDCLDDYMRFLYRVVVNVGPTVTQRDKLSDGTVIWQVTFTAVAGIPWEFGLPQQIVTNFPYGYNGAPFVNNAGGSVDTAGHVANEVACPSPIYSPVFDPACPQLVLPPSIPPIAIGCFTPPVNWRRRSFQIPATYIRDWTDMVPVINIKAQNNSVRNLRFRIYAEGIDPDATPCDHCADFLVSYQPSNSIMTIDGQDESIIVLNNGQTRRADSLVFGSDSLPFSWPALSCGGGYTVVMDSTQTQVMPSIDFALVPRAR